MGYPGKAGSRSSVGSCQGMGADGNFRPSKAPRSRPVAEKMKASGCWDLGWPELHRFDALLVRPLWLPHRRKYRKDTKRSKPARLFPSSRSLEVTLSSVALKRGPRITNALFKRAVACSTCLA